MNTDDFLGELYADFDWRWNEISRLKSIISLEADRPQQDDLRKSVVVVLYAHFEGFCVFALEHYLAEINRVGLQCGNANSAIVAGAWRHVFHALTTGEEKSKVFQGRLPNDAYLHLHSRRQHFVEEIRRLNEMRVQLPEDVIDTESNLKPQVLKRNLFLLGLNHDFVDAHSGTIQNLLGRRNRIAHGDDRRGVPEIEYDKYEMAAFEVCYRLIEFLDESHRQQKYRCLEPEYCL